jgi:hypothetical protein
VQSGAHRADRTTRCGWRLGVNPAIQVTQHHHLTITRRQAEDRAAVHRESSEVQGISVRDGASYGEAPALRCDRGFVFLTGWAHEPLIEQALVDATRFRHTHVLVILAW